MAIKMGKPPINNLSRYACSLTCYNTINSAFLIAWNRCVKFEVELVFFQRRQMTKPPIDLVLLYYFNNTEYSTLNALQLHKRDIVETKHFQSKARSNTIRTCMGQIYGTGGTFSLSENNKIDTLYSMWWIFWNKYRPKKRRFKTHRSSIIVHHYIFIVSINNYSVHAVISICQPWVRALLLMRVGTISDRGQSCVFSTPTPREILRAWAIPRLFQEFNFHFPC